MSADRLTTDMIMRGSGRAGGGVIYRGRQRLALGNFTLANRMKGSRRLTQTPRKRHINRGTIVSLPKTGVFGGVVQAVLDLTRLAKLAKLSLDT